MTPQPERAARARAAAGASAKTGTRTGRSFTGGRSIDVATPPLGGPYSQQQRQQDLAKLQQTTKRIAGPGKGAGNILHTLDVIGEQTIGLGQVRPSRMPGNILEGVGIGAHGLPHDAPPPVGDLKHPMIGMLPWSPFGRGPRVNSDLIKINLDAAAAEHAMTQAPIADVAKKYGVHPKQLERHIKNPRQIEGWRKDSNLHPDAPNRKAAQDINTGVQETLGDSGGHTWDRGMRSDRGNKGFAVSIPGHELKIPVSEFDQNDVVRFWQDKQAWLSKDKNLRVGSWRDGDNVYLDLTKIYGNRANALKAGQEGAQQAIYDRAAGAAIDVPPSGRVLPPDMPAHVQESARKITAGLSFGGAKKTREAQDALYNAERGKRAQEAERIMRAIPGEAGALAAREALAGELPKIEFNALKGKFGQQEVDDLNTYISNHDNMRTFEKVRAQEGLAKALRGEVPTDSERAMLHRVFGPEFVQAVDSARGTLSRIANAGLEIANIPRSLMASFDVSAPFRQGLIAGVRHPGMFFANFPLMMKSLVNEKTFQEAQRLIHQDPLFEIAETSGVQFTELGRLGQREEQFMSNLAEKIPVAGHGVRGSSRAYVVFLNKMRMDMFKYHLEAATKLKGAELTKHEMDSIGRFISAATGRGTLPGILEDAAPALNAAFFSPRLMMSRFNFISPRFYYKLSPYARKEAAKSMVNLIAFVGSVAYLAKLAGATVSLDPRNADFAKIRHGNTRVDLAGGFQQPIRLLAQLGSGQVISSTTGDVLSLGPGYGKMTRWDILLRFFEGKATPTASFAIDLFKGTNYQKQTIKWKIALDKELLTGGDPSALETNIGIEIRDRLLPLMLQDSIDQAMKTHGGSGSIPAAVGEYAVGAFGIGFQTYGPRDHARVRTTHLEADAKHLGMTPPSKEVLDDLRWKVRLQDVNKTGTPYVEKYKNFAALVDERYGLTGNKRFSANLPTNELAARRAYRERVGVLYRRYTEYNARLDRLRDRALSQGK